jgi:hypothetical protein
VLTVNRLQYSNLASQKLKSSINNAKNISSVVENNGLNPNFITGFFDAESSFSVLVSKNSAYKAG